MIKVNRSQLEQLRAVYGGMKAYAAKHNVYIVTNSEEEADAYQRFLSGELSRRQKKALSWYYKKRRRVKQTPTDAEQELYTP